jgi:hypothetical protein
VSFEECGEGFFVAGRLTALSLGTPRRPLDAHPPPPISRERGARAALGPASQDRPDPDFIDAVKRRTGDARDRPRELADPSNFRPRAFRVRSVDGAEGAVGAVGTVGGPSSNYRAGAFLHEGGLQRFPNYRRFLNRPLAVISSR